MEPLPWTADIHGTLIRQTVPRAEGQDVLRLTQIQEQVGRGEYRVDTQAVADAILRRLLGGAPVLVGPKLPQEECS
jgi:hypothetical protein